MTTMMKVICISPCNYIKRENGVFYRIKKGNFYYINRESIWIDSDGEAYGKVYSTNNDYIGQMLLSRFQSC